MADFLSGRSPAELLRLARLLTRLRLSSKQVSSSAPLLPVGLREGKVNGRS